MNYKSFTKSIRATLNITYYSIKMFFRNKSAVWFSIFLPVLIMGIFGVIDFGGQVSIRLGLVDNARNESSERVVEIFKEIEALDIHEGSLKEEILSTEENERDMVLVFPEEFGQEVGQLMQGKMTEEPTKVELYYNETVQPTTIQVGETIVNEVFESYSKAVMKSPDLFIVENKPVGSKDLSFIDFLIPGIVAMSIMQMNIFGVVGAIVSWRERGVLKRILATPVHPSVMIFSQVATRLIISVAQSTTLVAMGIFIFGINVYGSLGLVLLLALLGGVIFLNIGFTISGVSNTQNTVMAVANLVMMPQMFLSGVFFPREGLPDLLMTITDYLPLTYLAEGIRSVMIDGSGLVEISTQMYGLLAWVFITFFMAVKFFRWE